MATTLSRTGCAFSVTTRIEFQNRTGRLNAAQFMALISGWASAIETLWNGPSGQQRYGCCRVTFRVIAQVGSGTGGFHQVAVVAGPQTSTSGLGPGSRGGQWDDMDTGSVAAHETGHLMGLPDEYDYGGPDGAYRNLNPQPAGQPQSIMAQTWGSVAALQSHIDAILGGLGARCPFWCCLRVVIADWWVILRNIILYRPPRPPVPPEERHAHTSIGEIMLATRSVDEILDLIESGKPDAMGAGVVALHAKGSDAVAPLIDALKSPNTLRRWAAAATLGDLGDRDAVPALRDALSDRSISVRVHAAHSLAKLGANDGIPTLINAVSSEEIIIGHPPELVSDVANQALESVSGRSFGLDSSATPAMRRQIAERWDAWWRESRETPAQD